MVMRINPVQKNIKKYFNPKKFKIYLYILINITLINERTPHYNILKINQLEFIVFLLINTLNFIKESR